MKKCYPNRIEKTMYMGRELISVIVSSQAGVLWMSSDDPVVSKLMLEENGSNERTKKEFCVI